MKKVKVNEEIKAIAKAYDDWVDFYAKTPVLTEDEVDMLRSVSSRHTFCPCYAFLAGYRLGQQAKVDEFAVVVWKMIPYVVIVSFLSGMITFVLSLVKLM